MFFLTNWHVIDLGVMWHVSGADSGGEEGRELPRDGHAMQLIRRLDAVGAPYSIAVGRCVRAPAGLHLGLMVGGAQSYCVQTMRQTGDADQSRAAHKGGGKKGSWSGGGGGSGGYRQNRDGWDHARSGWGGPAPFRGSVPPPGAANMTPPTAQAAQAAPAAAAPPTATQAAPQAAFAQQAPPPAAQADSAQQAPPTAAPKASAAPAAQQEYWGNNWWEDGSQWWDNRHQYQDGGVDPYDDWAEDV